MGHGKEVKTRPDPKVEIQEKGEIFFFYRPKVGKDEAHGPDDVQRMYIVLRPEAGGGDCAVEEKQAPDSGKEGRKKQQDSDGGGEGGHGKEEVNIEEQPLLRLIVMGKKSLPDPAKRSQPYWGYVELVTTNVNHIKDALKEEEYSTATRGTRQRPAARALGEGVYRILKHDSGRRVHTHLIYKLELPSPAHRRDDAGEPQEAMNVELEASYLIQIKNPEQPPPSGGRRGGGGDGGFRGLQSKRRAAFPAHLQGRFGSSNRYAPADPPDLLNYEGCEFLLIAASDDVEEELGLELETETDAEAELGAAAAGCSDLVKMFGEVADVKPLLSGSWD
ncbi:hypothetical protein E2562_015399 [Oryza meyeriana var. granulata]|uniref:Uncharacterized protein n=1 Tax=Oryza meyeriana var. granulata TaxID=110450 RepID=A0A6G1EKJ4_9ORYZ|nr:hypothetical protein E2562_015399 [Oryza meyeriana var. granulata]